MAYSSAYFPGKNFAVTGAASGIGHAICMRLASLGANVSMADVAAADKLAAARDAVEAAARAAGHADTQVVARRADVRSTADVDAWMAATEAALGRLHGAANFAGVVGRELNARGIDAVGDDDWDFVLGVNLTGVMKSMRAEVRAFAPEGGSIVNCSSILGVVGVGMREAYCASKHGVVGLSRSAARELGPRGIRVNTVHPGYIATPMLTESTGVDLATIEAVPEVQNTTMRRLGKPEEVVGTVIFLLSSDSSFTTGGVHMVDGGWFV
ncbi:Short chain dehydrogenase reductase [Neofusicoccum parvum]|uniref:Short chain dehydrogenase reductase n=1 Tax=Neofusicoccum parvum TaxID=310453 RepID=A0ACB5RMU1_9PEZI|nr:Short chain dehydrogenase reductase [Neofusicoccum parvum]